MNNFTLHAQNFSLIKEMHDTPGIISNFDEEIVDPIFEEISEKSMLMITGEGSSRFFPARNMISRRFQLQNGPLVFSESAFDLAGLNLSDFVVLGTSNSGRTKEVVSLFSHQKKVGHNYLYGLTCNQNSLIKELTRQTVVLNIGNENAVAATKSAVAQALFYDFLLLKWGGRKINKFSLADDFEVALSNPVPNEITDIIVKADHIYIAGKNNGVAEELTIKTPETIRKKSAFLPSTYLLHGIEEVISKNDVIILVDEFPEHQDKINKIYVEDIGAKVISFAEERSFFPSIPITVRDSFNSNYVRLAAGWRLLAETGLILGINLDKPERARKIGNEMDTL